MEHGIYCTFDRKAQYCLPLFSAQNDVTAVRMFTEAVLTSETPVSQYPADFDLLRVGTVDLATGLLQGFVTPTPVVNGLVALTDAQRERARYQAILRPLQGEETSPEAA